MKWSPPRIEHCRPLAMRVLLSLFTVAGLSSGCSALPEMRSTSPRVADAAQSAASQEYTAAEKSRLAAMPHVPEFDGQQEKAVVQAAQPEIKPALIPPTVPPKTSPPASIPPASTPPKADTPKVAAPNTTNPASESQKVATSKPTGVLVTPPKPFSWEQTGKSAGNRPLQTASLGEDGYRTLVIGSVGGNDPLALELVDKLARHLHENSVILGGFDCTIIRTLNPDGEANHKFLNQNDQYINHGFPQSGAKGTDDQPPEVAFLLNRLKELQPQRVVHIRTIEGANGLIAASYSCQPAAKEAADWLKFKLVMLPENARAAGSMERYISTSGISDMITVGIPDTSDRAELWDRYGDTLLNLLLGEDMAAREIARKQAQQSSADRRNQSPGK